MAKLADDSGAAIKENAENMTIAVEMELEDQLQWYEKTGLVAEDKKTEIMPIKCELGELKIKGKHMNPVQEVKFLSIYLQSNSKLAAETRERTKKLNKEAAWIRSMWYLTTNRRIKVYKAVVHGRIVSNARIYLPELKMKQSTMIQVAVNAALRAAAGLSAKGKTEHGTLRKMYMIPTLGEIQRYETIKAAWNKRELYEERSQIAGSSMTTRSGLGMKKLRSDTKFETAQIDEYKALQQIIKKAKTFPKNERGDMFGERR